MAFQTGKPGSGPYVPPIFDRDAKDRFGLPLVWSILGERPEEREARISAAERLMKDAFETATRHLGHEEARTLFAKVSKKPYRGKRPKAERNKEILECYDREVKAGRVPTESIPRLLAEKRYSQRQEQSVEACEKQIRRLLKDLEKATTEHEGLYPSTLLTGGTTITKRERDI